MEIKLALVFAIALLLFGCKTNTDSTGTNQSESKPVPEIDFKFNNAYPHDTTSFTEGFLMHDGNLYESAGATKELPQTRSLFGIVDLKTGKIDVKAELDKNKYFGEGITFLHGKVYQLTYKTKIGFVYDAISFKKIKEFALPTEEGWGMTTDGTNLIMSDGTFILTYLDPETLKVIKSLKVTENGCVKEYLNELEYIKGYIYANIYTTNTIVKIDPNNGEIVGKLDLSDLANDAKNLFSQSLEMNGIAYDSIANKTYVTGKLWPKIYELTIN